jgi:hypothetical protein
MCERLKYDAIISLGGNCAAASQLQIRGLRNYSLPFDWLYMMDPKAISFLATEFPSGLPNFFKRENLCRFECLQRNGTAPFHYKDDISRFCFIHHFSESLEEGGYEDVEVKIKRRIKRMFDLIENAECVLFILATAFPFESFLSDKLVNSFRNRWPRKRIDFHIMQFGVNELKGGVLSDILTINGYDIYRYKRQMDSYDISFTSSEWSFLDNLVLQEKRRRFSFFDGILYKIWKKISKRLKSKGYGCLGARF